MSAAVEGFVIGHLELRRSVVLNERTRVIFTVSALALFFCRLEGNILLHTFQNFVVLLAGEEKTAEFGFNFDHRLVVDCLDVKRSYIALRNHQLKIIGERIPRSLLEDETEG